MFISVKHYELHNSAWSIKCLTDESDESNLSHYHTEQYETSERQSHFNTCALL